MIFNFLKNKKLVFKKTEQKYLYDEMAKAKNAEGFSSFIDRLPNPDVILRKAGKNISVLEKLTNHYQVGACIEQRKAGVTAYDWELLPNDTNKNHLDLYNEIFENLDIHTLITNILDAPLFGYVPIEIIWEKDNGYIIPVKCIAKPQEWFYFNSDGEFFFKDKTKSGKLLIDLNSFKFLLPRNNPTFKNPYGTAILSRCFWNVAFINGGMEFWVKFSEKYGMPYTFGKYDRNMTDKEKKEFMTGLTNMVQDAIALIPSDGSVNIVPTGSTANSDIYEKLVDKCEKNISKAILGQTLTTDVGSNGSYAASKTHSDVRADIVFSDMALVEKTINKLIQYINIINFDDDNTPIFKFIVPEDLQIPKIERDNKIAALGVEFSEEYLNRTYGFKKGDIKVVEKPNMNFEDDKNAQNFNLNNSYPETKDFLNAEDMEKLLSGELQKVIKFFDETSNAEETLDKLAELYPDFNTEKLEEVLAKVIFISDLKGRLDKQNGQ